MAKKFIICNDNLILGNVQFHMDLVNVSERHNIIGGGYWHRDVDRNVIYFYGTSHDFGSVTPEEFDASNKTTLVERSKKYFSQMKSLGEVLEEEKLKNL